MRPGHARVVGVVPDCDVAIEKRLKGLIDLLLIFAECRFCEGQRKRASWRK